MAEHKKSDLQKGRCKSCQEPWPCTVTRLEADHAQLVALVQELECDEKIVLEMFEALDGLPFTGKKTPNGNREYLSGAKRITLLREQYDGLVALVKALPQVGPGVEVVEVDGRWRVATTGFEFGNYHNAKAIADLLTARRDMQ